MKSGVIVFPGSNCDRDVVRALKLLWGEAPVSISYKDTELPPLDLIILPGGFSYGDYLRCGALAAHSPIMQAVREQAQKGVAILGICNGFQILTEAGLLPGALTVNKSLRFMSQLVSLKIENNQSPFTHLYQQGEVIKLPIANKAGAYVASNDVLAQLEDDNRIAMRYVDDINGSLNCIAGIFDSSKRILGLMPHPERFIDMLQGGTDGARLLQGLLS